MCLPKFKGGLGFRDLNTFNLALSAKQCWRILQNPDVFWVKLLKARYFPNCGFLQAEVGYRPSWAWASLIEGIKGLRTHLHRQVMNGLSTNIWTDNWLPPPHSGAITPTRQVPLSTPQWVHDILYRVNRVWTIQTISPYISAETANVIGGLPLGNTNRADRIVWPWNSVSEYTVRSGYNIFYDHGCSNGDNSHMSHQIP